MRGGHSSKPGWQLGSNWASKCFQAEGLLSGPLDRALAQACHRQTSQSWAGYLGWVPQTGLLPPPALCLGKGLDHRPVSAAVFEDWVGGMKGEKGSQVPSGIKAGLPLPTAFHTDHTSCF